MTAAIVVFGAAVSATGQPLPPLVRRLERALTLARAHPEALVVVSGGRLAGRPAEAPSMAAWLTAHGLAASRLRLETEARNTADNALRVVPILRQAAAVEIWLVTERFHMARSLHLLRWALQRGDMEHIRVMTCPCADNLGPGYRLIAGLREGLALLLWRARRHFS